MRTPALGPAIVTISTSKSDSVISARFSISTEKRNAFVSTRCRASVDPTQEPSRTASLAALSSAVAGADATFCSPRSRGSVPDRPPPGSGALPGGMHAVQTRAWPSPSRSALPLPSDRVALKLRKRCVLRNDPQIDALVDESGDPPQPRRRAAVGFGPKRRSPRRRPHLAGAPRDRSAAPSQSRRCS